MDNLIVSVNLVVLLGSVILDLIMGEPPELIHPVVWIGRAIGYLKKRFAAFGRDKFFGALLVLLVVIGSGGLGFLAVKSGSKLWPPFGIIVGIYLLKSTFSVRSLISTVTRIGDMMDSDTEEARGELIALVGRNRSNLSRAEMRSAAIESLFENIVDSLISPLFYYFLGSLANFQTGIALALLFKALNTVDSMIGYRTESLMDFGYLGARLDDLLNWIPARLSPLFVALASFSLDPLRLALRDWAKPASPNSGWPMSAGSGALKVRLVKRSHYELGAEFDLPGSETLSMANRLAARTAGIYLLLISGVMVFLNNFT